MALQRIKAAAARYSCVFEKEKEKKANEAWAEASRARARATLDSARSIEAAAALRAEKQDASDLSPRSATGAAAQSRPAAVATARRHQLQGHEVRCSKEAALAGPSLHSVPAQVLQYVAVVQPKARDEWQLSPDGSTCLALAKLRGNIVMAFLPNLQGVTLIQPAWVTALRWHVPRDSSEKGLQAAMMLDAGQTDFRRIIVQDLRAHQTVRDIYVPGASCTVRLFSWSPHAQYLLLALASGSAVLYNITTGAEHKLAAAITRPVIWAPDSSTFAAKVFPSNKVMVFETSTPMAVWEMESPEHHLLTPLTCFVYWQSGRFMLITSAIWHFRRQISGLRWRMHE
ncbi:hypothetical protein WJX73_008552 [Symbiochloris irregularis]|uniref:Uncharacterized protein n=1 Tax=Symbiochloris irregularis TaxID=706552 RepID=A0AAW1NW35_9CHLO